MHGVFFPLSTHACAYKYEKELSELKKCRDGRAKKYTYKSSRDNNMMRYIPTSNFQVTVIL